MLEASRDSEPNVASSTTYALSQLGTPGALSRLEEMARASTPASGQALQALASAAPERAGPIAAALARGSDAQARLAAVQISSMLPPEASKQIVVDAVRSDDSMVVREALGMLGTLGLPTSELEGLLKPLRQNKELPEDIGQLAAQLLGES
jgi:hypothetical protein